MRLLPTVVLALGLGTLIAFARQPAYDIVIRGGRVVDGTGNPAYTADVAVKDGKIVKIGRIKEAGKEEIEAKGAVITPGFIDVHTHAENVTRFPRADNFLRMGVTSIVIGNCGGSERDLEALFKRIDEKGASLNVASLIGHNTVRQAAMGGSFDRPPTDDELNKMREMVRKAMRDGAVGLSTGLIYLPGTFSKTDEIVELAKIASEYDGIYATHMRSEGLGIFDALNETFRIAREADIRAQVSHIKLSGNAMWGKSASVVEALEKARAEGLDVTQDQYCYTASSTGIGQLVPDSAREGGQDAYRKRIADPEQKAKIKEQMKRTLERNGRTDYTYAAIANYSRDKSLNGKRIPEAAKLKRGSDSLDDQMELILEMQANGGASGVFHGMHEDDLQAFMRHPNTMVASDSGIRDPNEGVPHPRGYGNNARVLHRYVRELGVLRLEDAVRRMTSLPATVFRLRDRGFVREGMAADLVVFNPAEVKEETSFEDPHKLATGFRAVIVNGVRVVREDVHTGALPGRALRAIPELSAKERK
jgi:N-acyl-D-amino-acid deacylase